jgi:hypothetical protein
MIESYYFPCLVSGLSGLGKRKFTEDKGSAKTLPFIKQYMKEET